MNIKVNNPNINDISCKNTSKTFGQVVVSASSTVFKEVAIMSKNIQVIAQKIGVEIIFEGSQIHLEKEIDGKIWRMLTIDNAKKAVDVVVDIKRFRRSSISSGLTADDMRIPGYTVRQVHELRGPLVWLLNADSKGREIVTPQGKRVFVKMVLEERKLRNGDIVRYNTWDFSPYALYEAQLSEDTILCESPEHKREFILQLADDFCSGRTNLEDKLSPEIKEQLRKIHETRKAPAYLSGYEIHHDGYGNMFLLPKEIHCRKLAHIGGSYLMNTRNYAVYIESQTLDESVGKILSEELTIDKINFYEDFTIEEKERFISSIGNRILRNTGLSDVRIEFSDNLKSTTCGSHSSAEKRIVINRNLLKSPLDALHTELHEIRHAIQHDAVQHPEKYGFDAQTIEIWQRNIAYYISPKLDYEAYVLQPIEIDAETWASKMLHDFKTPLYV